MSVKSNNYDESSCEVSVKNVLPVKNPPKLLSRFLFLWILPIFYNGNRRDLEEYDLVPPKNIYNSKYSGDKLERIWLEEEILAKARGQKPSFLKVLLKTFGWSYLPGGLMQLGAVVLRTIAPLLFVKLLKYWATDSDISRTTASYYAAAMLLAYALASFLNNHGILYCQQFGMKLRVATSSLIFRKIMRMDNGSLGETAAGKVINILSNDLLRFDLAFLYINYVWIVPLQIAAIWWLSYAQAGYAALIGLGTLLIIVLPAQVILGKFHGKARHLTAPKTDERIKLMSEIISGIQVIKMYAWEIPFEKMVQQRRESEMKYIRRATLYRTVLLGFLFFAEKTALFITILALILTGTPLSANVIYPLQQFMSSMQVNLTLMLPMMLSFSAELKVTMKRVQDFLWLSERSDLVASLTKIKNTRPIVEDSDKSTVHTAYRHNYEAFVNKGFTQTEEKIHTDLSAADRTIAVELKDVSASWIGDSNFLALKKLSLSIPKEKLCAIIGPVGSGKSSLLQLLLKELTPCSGVVSVNGKISYAAQEPWLFSATVRENILFGLAFEPSKYKKVCRVCELETDFRQFPFGDQTLVGERGVSLSGGQRSRINLARSIYREADIYLLDDPLSAVDSNVGRQLFEDCINGYLRNRTRILVTHQVHFLKAADLIVIINEGTVASMGTFEELISRSKEFAMMLQDDEDKKSLSISEFNEKIPRLKSLPDSTNKDHLSEFETQKMAAEKKESGNLRWGIISGYFTSGCHWCFVIFTFALIFNSASSSGACDYWISYWSNQISAYEKLHGVEIELSMQVKIGKFTVAEYLIILGSIVLSCIVISSLRVLPFLNLTMSASKALHHKMFSAMLRGIMRFFDTSSSGRILNRFAKDIGTLDEVLPRALLDVVQISSSVLVVIVLNAIALQWTLIPSLCLMLLFGLCVKIYLKAAQGIKRLEGITKSPVFNTVTSTLNGISTIRSTGAQDRLIEEFDQYQDLHTSAWVCYLGGAVSFGFFLDILCLTYLAMIIFAFLYLDIGSLIAVGSVGLAVTQTNTLTGTLQYGARMFVEFVAQLTCVERVLEYTHIESEPYLFHGEIETPSRWPANGKITFINLNLRYAPEESPVLKNLNITVESGWKVGIVGRTGAGKSSLISALFRFAYLDGNIMIDDVETSRISKQDLRSKISIIPQEPVLFSASIRYNLDPFDLYSDEEIWRALEQVDMKLAVPSLDFTVTEGGGNFSVGQRQLICLARAILRSNKILIMDEATANVDPQTDSFIQKTIRQQFTSCTVLTIAHRLNTIMDSDRVLVMDKGEVVEYDYPYVLLTNPNSHFTSMVRETGENNSIQLFQIAKDTYFLSNLKENKR